ncbi:hypothetical protein FQU23_012280 [Flavobacterium sp. XN-5]|uniref:hypothetical protein n=1 Tax=Flavobacterium sp. XN-5 TaxID=2599390 RepID=UPI0011C74AFB|nr:hypothetical protein [Flavobacterium sp. XN-5]NGY38287.1 hypothetical protein [Flavobacterium sp. XN-5]
MERFSKKSSSKWHDGYSEEFKRFVYEKFLRSFATKQEIEIEYSIGKPNSGEILSVPAIKEILNQTDQLN